MHYEVKKIDYLSFAFLSGSLAILFTLLPMLFASIALITRMLRRGFSIEILFLIFFPLGIFLVGFILGFIWAFVYNLIAQRWHGLKLEIIYNSDEEQVVNKDKKAN